MWFEGILRTFFLFIDKVIYWVVEVVYNLFHSISMTGVFTPDAIREFGSRIYVLLGVFMLFKVSFSLITYILNPDQMTDKSKGMGKLSVRIIVALIGIIIVPYAFQAAYSLQAIVLKDNVIGSIVMGMDASILKDNPETYLSKAGDLMSYTTLSAFIRLNPAIVGEECSAYPVVSDESGNVGLNARCDHEIFETTVFTGNTVGATIVDAYTQSDVTPYFNTNFMSLKAENMNTNEDDWLFDYTFLISSIAGGFLAWILLIFCIDVATRSVKLGFLQLVAPIPIISYVDPKGEKTFNNWLKECGKTYADLFIRLVGIYFVIYIIILIVTGGIYNIVDPSAPVSFLVKVFIIFGALMFAKQLPDLISNILGIKLGGFTFTLNPMKKLGQSPYAAGLVGAVGGAVGGGIANAWAAHKNGLGFGAGTLSTIGGIIGGGRRGLVAGATSGGKGSALDAAVKGITDSSARRNLRKFGQGVNGYSTWDMVMDKATTMAGVKYSGGTSSQLKSEINQLQERLNNAKMTEQNNSSALQHRISEQGNKMAALLATFNGEYKLDNKGNLSEYVEKNYSGYLEQAGRQYVKEQGFNWDNITQADRDAVLGSLEGSDYVVDKSTFDSLNSLYEARNNADLEGRGLQKQIKDMQEDMEKFKGKGK